MVLLSLVLVLGLCAAYLGNSPHVMSNRIQPSCRPLLRRAGWTIVGLGGVVWIAQRGFERGVIDILTLMGALGILMVSGFAFFGPTQRQHKTAKSLRKSAARKRPDGREPI